MTVSRKATPEPKRWDVPCRIEYEAVVTVEAASAAEAKAKFDASEWIDSELSEMVNWDLNGHPKEQRP